VQPNYTDLAGSPTLPNLVDNETPTGAVNGVNAVFTIANVPNPPSSLKVWNDGGQLLKPGGVDYTLSGATITYAAASIPQIGDVPTYSYRFGSASAPTGVSFADSEIPSGLINNAN